MSLRQSSRLPLLAVFLCISGAAGAQAIPQDEESFTNLVAERVAKELPEFNIKPAGKLLLEGKRADGESTGQLNLDRIYSFCGRNTGNCRAAIEQYAKGMAEVVRDRARPIEKDMVRLSVRGRAFVNQARQQMGTGPVAIYARPLTVDLAIVPVLDFTRSVRFVGENDLLKLGVTEDELFKLGEKNLRATLRPLSEVAQIPVANSLGRVAGEDYAASRIILHADWKDIAAKLNQQLVVMVPAPDVVLYGDGSTPVGLDALRTLGMEIARKSSRPLSPLLLRWKESGWEQLK